MSEKEIVDCTAGDGQLDCSEVAARLDDFVDREMTADELEDMRHHLERCIHCTDKHDEKASFVAEVKAKLRRIEAPPALRSRLASILAEEG